MDTLDAVVVGAGQAGLAVSYCLAQMGCRHRVLERGRIGETWLTQRWDSFRLNTPNFMSTLPGLPYEGPEPGGFAPAESFVRYLEGYAAQFDLPVRTGVSVVAVRQAQDGAGFIVETTAEGRAQEPLRTRSIVIAAGIQQVPKLPALHSQLPADIKQMHSADYRSPDVLPPGAVVIVGGGQSGCQIAEDLLAARRAVYLCSSKVWRVPRRYRGRDILEWWIDMGFLDATYDSLEDKSMSRAAQPQISGIGPQGHTLSLQSLARQGVVILGRLKDVQGETLILGDEAAGHTRYADEFSQQVKARVDAYLEKAGIQPPPLEDDPADEPDPEAKCASPLRELSLSQANVGAVIWATGYTGDFSWIHLPILDDEGRPMHHRGASPVRGLYFMGYPWLSARKSGIIYGVGDDARHIAGAIAGEKR